MHPLAPLSAEEIGRASLAVRTLVGVDASDDPHLEKLRFVAISLKEPAKAALLPFLDGDVSVSLPRQAEIVVLSSTTGLATEYVVDLFSDGSAKVVQSVSVPSGSQPMLTPDDCDLAESIVHGSPEVAAALKERYDIHDVSRVACDPWSINLASDEEAALLKWNQGSDVPARLVQTFLSHRQNGDDRQDNHYAHPIDVLPIVDLNARKLVHIGDLHRPAPKIPNDSVNYHRDLLKTNTYLQTTWREEILTVLDVVQPDGPSFQVSDDNLVKWQKWTLCIGFNYREGLVLHDVRYDGRPVMHRASLVEMAVPYGDPYPPHQRKCAFDVGDYGLGYCANNLELGCDCLGTIHYFDAVLANAAGNPQLKEKVICMHEEDQGILWKHVEFRNAYNESRRSRELVISSIATVVNYEYLFYWRLKLDGGIDFEIKLSGELSTNLPSPAEDGLVSPTHGVLVAPGVNSQFHQHIFCVRLDMAVDGPLNTVSEIDVVTQPLDPKKNPYGNAFGPVETMLETEKAAIRSNDSNRARTWRVSNASGKINGITGKPTAYKLVPFTRGPAQPTLLVDSSSAVAKKGAFARAHLWVTPHADNERFPAGEYTPQGDGSVGLTDWTAANRCIVKRDIVLWHSFGVCHVPRVEDFPVCHPVCHVISC
jgi:primary-amine oxidase